MDTHDERDLIASLERRVEALERAVAGLAGKSAILLAPTAPSAAVPAASATAGAPPPMPSIGTVGKVVAPPAKAERPFALHLGPMPAEGEPAFDLEQWLGARGLLLVGVVALLTAAGYFLKYAFDRGWVAPGVRVLGAILLGIGVGVYAESRVRSGMRRFGLALLGAGGGLVYLGAWAAAGPYQLISPTAGIAAITVTAMAVAARSVHHDAEGLALWALLGAFMAPLVLRPPNPNPEFFLSYVAVVGFATAALAQEMGWRIAFSAGLGGSLFLALTLVGSVLNGPLGFLFFTASGVAALYLSSRSWLEARVFFIVVLWIAFVTYAADARGAAGTYALLGGLVLFLAGWRQQLDVTALHARRLSTSSPAEELVGLFVAPIAYAMIATRAGGAFLNQHPAVSFGTMAVLYLETGWRGRWAAFVGLGWAFAAVALILAFTDTALVWALSGAIVVGAAADRWQDQEAMAPATLAMIFFAGLGVFLGLVFKPRADESALLGAWSLAMYGYLVSVAIAATWWRVGTDRAAWARKARSAGWVAAGAVLFLGVSVELLRLFAGGGAGVRGSGLAAGLSISVWWLLYAALLVRLGFARNLRDVRRAGLSVAVLAAGKIALVDLSSLEALYRVTAFFVLALIALAVAYAYNRRYGASVGGGPAVG